MSKQSKDKQHQMFKTQFPEYPKLSDIFKTLDTQSRMNFRSVLKDIEAPGARIESAFKDMKALQASLQPVLKDIEAPGARIESAFKDMKALQASLQPVLKDIEAPGARIESAFKDMKALQASLQPVLKILRHREQGSSRRLRI